MWTVQKHVPRWDLPAGLVGAQLGVETPSQIHKGASRHSLALFMRLRLASVVGEFLWSGERYVDDDIQCFPGGL